MKLGRFHPRTAKEQEARIVLLIQESGGRMESALGDFRRSVHDSAQRPQGFWDRQRAAVMTSLAGPPHAPAWQATLAWAAAAALVIIGISIFIDQPHAIPPPDFAAGYDQELLIDVERSIGREVPQALDAAMLLVQEIERSDQTQDGR